jgi:hypothetical protein
MGMLQKILGGVVITGLVTSVILPGRQSPAVLNSILGGLSKVEHTAITGQN